MGVFPIINRINHSCNPNCSVSWNSDTNMEEVFIMEKVEQGEELTISYLDMVTATVTRQQRQEYLATHFMFHCQCSLCSMSPDQVQLDDQTRDRVKTLTLSLKNDKTSNPADQISVLHEINLAS